MAIPPPPEKKISIRTMNSDIKSSSRTESFQAQILNKEQKKEVEESIEPQTSSDLTSLTSEFFSISNENPSEKEIPRNLKSMTESNSDSENEQPPVPQWAKERLNQEEIQRPVTRKATMIILIIIAVIVGFIYLGYFISSRIIFR